MKVKAVISIILVVLVTSVLASSGGGEEILTKGSWEMRYKASVAQSGTVTQCIGGLVSLGFTGQQDWSVTGSASTTTPNSQRPASYLGVWLQLWQTAVAQISFAQMIAPTGPQTAVSASATNERRCFSEPLATGWRTVSTHKARPMPNDPDAMWGDWYVSGYERQ